MNIKVLVYLLAITPIFINSSLKANAQGNIIGIWFTNEYKSEDRVINEVLTFKDDSTYYIEGRYADDNMLYGIIHGVYRIESDKIYYTITEKNEIKNTIEKYNIDDNYLTLISKDGKQKKWNRIAKNIFDSVAKFTKSGLVSINGEKIKNNENKKEQDKFEIYKETDIIPKIKNISFGIAWSKRNENNDLTMRFRIKAFCGNLNNTNQMEMFINREALKKYNIEYIQVITLDNDDDFSNKYYIIELYIDDILFEKKVFTLE
jgi:hypothetical protein